MTEINTKLLSGKLTYPEYLNQMRLLLEEGAQNHLDYSSALLEYTQLNLVRMERWDKRLRFEELDLGLKSPVELMVITEGWCGDAAHITPVFQKVAEANPLLTLFFINRDQHLEIMDAFLTNGGRSIPKAILLDSQGRVLGSWGPRPNELQTIFMEMRQSEDYQPEEAKVFIQKWYNKDKGLQTLNELKEWIRRRLVA